MSKLLFIIMVFVFMGCSDGSRGDDLSRPDNDEITDEDVGAQDFAPVDEDIDGRGDDLSRPDIDETIDENIDEDIDGRGDDLSRPDEDESVDEMADETPDEDIVLPVITDITVEENPNSTISCIVSWKTDIPANSSVTFFADAGQTFIISDENETTTHRIAVVGMKDSREYHLSVISGDAEQTAGSFTTKALPVHLSNQSITIHQVDKTFNGWTLFTVASVIYIDGVRNPDPDFPGTMIAYDMDGDVVWYSIQSDMRQGDLHYYPETGLISSTPTRTDDPMQAAYREVNWEGVTVFDDPKYSADTTISYHHAFVRTNDGHLWSIRNHEEIKEYEDGTPVTIVGDDLVEMDSLGNVLWAWNVFDHQVFDPSTIPPEQEGVDWTHANSFDFNDTLSQFYFNARNLSKIYKIDRATGDLLWTLGTDGDFTVDGDDTDFWFSFAHAVDVLDNGNILLYDNGNDARDYSRAIEYELDEIAMTAKIVWQYGNEVGDKWQTFYWGDADRLPNGNTQVVAGSFSRIGASAIKEIDASGEKVWELSFPHDGGESVLGMYNAERIIPPVQVVE